MFWSEDDIKGAITIALVAAGLSGACFTAAVFFAARLVGWW